MLLEEGAEEQGQVLDEVLLIFFPVLVSVPDVGAQGQHLQQDDSWCGEYYSLQLIVVEAPSGTEKPPH